MAETAVAEVMAELAELEDPKAREVNEKRGDDHAVNLSKLRAVAKRLKTQQDLARELWKTDDSSARLLATLICRPKAFERDELDAMLRESRTPKVHDWLVNYVVKKSPHSEELRLAWLDDADPVIASAGWALTIERVMRKPDGPRPRQAARRHRGGDEGRAGPPAVGDERLPGQHRDQARGAPRPRDRDR
ncbi:3-methyladenine DNA glycosylase AlkD [Actinomadura luteofluorescens]|uniref:3-methyladenine DNA glycosylase AlkD n=1 Tax=Actinomadura luteofluorescens TaxID=46163 RepID=A0A7Y9ERM4_9ACTN|nr:DNA alkylation repair protein [Actinomadura luteofluorescens]NYD52531.1 3-methyladenine DNA glycosylase AlkD [Actinomadura luteofluorescens]